MYSDLVFFSDLDAMTETVCAIRLLCLPRGRVRIYVPAGARDIGRERLLLERAAGSGAHISLDALDPVADAGRIASQIASNCHAVSVIRPAGTALCLGVLERTLLKRSSVPVWFWNNRLRADFGVVVAGDPDPHNAQRDGLNRDAVDLAVSLAQRARGSIIVANAWQLDGEADMRSSPFLKVTEEEIETARREIQHIRSEWLAGLAARCVRRDVAVETALREGPADQAIPAIVNDCNASFLVVGTMRRSGFAALVRPNMGLRLASGFHGSVVIVPPSDADAETGGGRLSRIAAGVAFA